MNDRDLRVLRLVGRVRDARKRALEEQAKGPEHISTIMDRVMADLRDGVEVPEEEWASGDD